MTLTAACLLAAVAGCVPTPRTPAPPPAPAEVRVATWNIEMFDAAGQDDATVPTRGARHLGLIAETALRTGADVIGLQEVEGPLSPGGPYSLEQLAAEMNRLEESRGRAASWRHYPEKPPRRSAHCALLWNDGTLELLGSPAPLSSLRYGYGGKSGNAPSEDARRFFRAPLAARFRVRAAPSNDFTMVVVQLRGGTPGLYGGLDSNDIRRRGEWEDLLRKWLLDPAAQGPLRDEDLVIAGDMSEDAPMLVRLLDDYGTGDDVRGRLVLDRSDFSDPAAALLFADGALSAPAQYTFQANFEKGEKIGETAHEGDGLAMSRRFTDHILVGRRLADAWDGGCRIDYFEKIYPLRDHVRISDHRPVCIALRFPPG